MKISEIRAALSGQPTEAELAEWRLDSRKGVQTLLKAYAHKREKEEAEVRRIEYLLRPERALWEKGYEYVAGTDEAGRGPLAGPLVTAAVILPHKIHLPGLNDSKQVSPKRRESLYDEILEQALAVTVMILGPREIDEMNIYQAAKSSMVQCLVNLSVHPDAALTDAMPLQIPSFPVTDIVHGDGRSAVIAAASIIAKVTRDRLMEKLDRQYPEYGFASHKGYGSQLHMEAIRKYGPSPWHRRSYEPLKSMPACQAAGPAISESRLVRLK